MNHAVALIALAANAQLCGSEGMTMQMAQAGAPNNVIRLRSLLGSHCVSASAGSLDGTDTLIEKVKTMTIFDDTERATLVRALEWCVRGGGR